MLPELKLKVSAFEIKRNRWNLPTNNKAAAHAKWLCKHRLFTSEHGLSLQCCNEVFLDFRWSYSAYNYILYARGLGLSVGAWLLHQKYPSVSKGLSFYLANQRQRVSVFIYTSRCVLFITSNYFSPHEKKISGLLGNGVSTSNYGTCL